MSENPIIRIDQKADIIKSARSGYQFPFLDEFIAEDVSCVHFEAMGQSQFWCSVRLKDGREFDLNFGAVNSQAKGYSVVEEQA